MLGRRSLACTNISTTLLESPYWWGVNGIIITSVEPINKQGDRGSCSLRLLTIYLVKQWFELIYARGVELS